MAGSLYFEDIQVGYCFESQSYRIDDDEIRRFAQEFDPQPFHLNEMSGRHSLFGDLVASGWHTAALTMRLLVSANPFAGGLVGLDAEVRWRRPTRPGDEFKVFTEVIDKGPFRSRTEHGLVVIRAETRDQNEDVLQILVSRFLVPVRPKLAEVAIASGTGGPNLTEPPLS
ncbi:MAG: MaoC/PaaZ C-terminal domain-containing protein [Candidatus Acidiferrales bacterium]